MHAPVTTRCRLSLSLSPCPVVPVLSNVVRQERKKVSRACHTNRRETTRVLMGGGRPIKRDSEQNIKILYILYTKFYTKFMEGCFSVFSTHDVARRPSVIRPAPIIIVSGTISVSALFCRSPVFACLGPLRVLRETGTRRFFFFPCRRKRSVRCGGRPRPRHAPPVPSPPPPSR